MVPRNLLDYMKNRATRFKEQVERLLGTNCERCKSDDAHRIEFRSLDHPLRKTYAVNRPVLYRKVLDGEFNSSNLKLLCNECWRENRRTWKEEHEPS